MCLAIPGKIISVDDDNMAMLDFSGVQKTVSLDLLQDVSVDDYVLVHAGFAIEKIDKSEAEETLSLLRDMQKM